MADIEKTAAKKKPSKDGLGGTLRVFAEALIIALIVRSFLFQPFEIPSGSLIPTLEVGDYLFVSKYSYGYSRYSFPYGLPPFNGRIWGEMPDRGDIAVFKGPKDNSTDYIKRVIGLPGDTIQMREGRLFINDQVVARSPLPPHETKDFFGNPIQAQRYEETLPNGTTHEIIEIEGDSGSYDNTPRFEVPPGHLFMMGDNRDNSADSRDMRSIGYVPYENLVGKARWIFFSIADGARVWEFWKWPTSIRWSRMFTTIN